MSMSRHVGRATQVGLALAATLALAAEKPRPPETAPTKAAPPAAPSYKMSGPYAHENLTIYLIHGDDQLKGKTFLTLSEALQQKKLIVYETQNVNQLAIENVSANEEVFVLSGDIVKGGKQDRIIAYDLIVPAKSGRMPLAAFCCENGRWTRRGSESPTAFVSGMSNTGTKDLKIAVRKDMAQDKVWENVGKAQQQLGENLRTTVHDARSASSLQLTLENKKVQEATDAYVKKMQSIADNKDDVIGYAFAVNGVMSSADVFASHGLFMKLWPTLLKSTAVEAVAEVKKDLKIKPVTVEIVTAFLADAEKGKQTGKEVTKRVRIVEQETKDNLLYRCTDAKCPGVDLRRNYLKK
jgi:hypothetical protein